MRLENQTSSAATSLSIRPSGEAFCAVVIVKTTYDWHDDGSLTESEEQLPLFPQGWECAFGRLHGEAFYKKSGADICVLGTAKSHRPVASMKVSLRVGEFESELQVVGDRFWEPDGAGELVSGAAQLFTEMPVSYARAFGGAGREAEISYQDNPDGRGYYSSAEEADGKPLPNIEPLGRPLVRRWSPVPERPAGWGPYPSYWGLRGAKEIELSGDSQSISRVRPSLFNHAHPDLVVRSVAARTPVELMLGATVRKCAVPTGRRVEVQLGARRFRANAKIDGLYLFADSNRVVVTQRARFKYEIVPEEIRRAYVVSVPLEDSP